jgi:hypothetical protein
MMKRVHIVILCAVAALFVGAYFISPYAAVQALKSAARGHDRKQLEKLVDFPSVREGLKSQMKAYVLEQMRSDPEMQNNPFAGFALALAPMMIDGAIEAYVTPDAMASIVDTGRPASSTKSEKPMPSHPAEVTQGYKDLNTFDVSIVGRDEYAGATDLVFERQGLFAWRLTRINLPIDALPKT